MSKHTDEVIIKGRFTTEWGRMVSDSWLTYEQALEVAATAGFLPRSDVNNTEVTDGEYGYVLRFKQLTIVPGLRGLVWYWDSEQEDNL